MADSNGFTYYSEPPEYLNAVDVVNFMNNITAIRNRMKVKGYTVDTFIPKTAKTSTPLVEIKGILNHIESGIDIINKAIESQYYGSSVRYENYAPYYEDVQRWINIFNDLYDQVK